MRPYRTGLCAHTVRVYAPIVYGLMHPYHTGLCVHTVRVYVSAVYGAACPYFRKLWLHTSRSCIFVLRGEGLTRLRPALAERPAAYLPQYGRYYQSGSDTEYKTVNPPRQRVVIAVFFVLNTRFFNLVIPIAFCIFFCIGVDGITAGRAPAYKLVRSA